MKALLLLFCIFSTSSVSTAQSVCADISWEVEQPYPFIPNAFFITRNLQVNCFSYQQSATINASGRIIPWFNNTLPVSDTNLVQWSTSYLWTNPESDNIISQYRLFWDLSRTTLTSESNYQRMAWKQGAEELLSNSVSHSLSSYTVENKDKIKNIYISIWTICSAPSEDKPTETQADSQTQFFKRIPSRTEQIAGVGSQTRLPDLQRIMVDQQYALQEFHRVVNPINA